MFQWLFSTVQPWNLSSTEGEEVVDSDTTFLENLQNIMDKCNEAENDKITEQSQHFAKELVVFFFN